MDQPKSKPRNYSSNEKYEIKFLMTLTPTQEANLNEMSSKLGISRTCLIRQLLDMAIGQFVPSNKITEGERSIRNWGGEQNLERQEQWQSFLTTAQGWPGP